MNSVLLILWKKVSPTKMVNLDYQLDKIENHNKNKPKATSIKVIPERFN